MNMKNKFSIIIILTTVIICMIVLSWHFFTRYQGFQLSKTPSLSKNTQEQKTFSVVGQVKDKGEDFILIEVSKGSTKKLLFNQQTKFLKVIYKKAPENALVIDKIEPISLHNVNINDSVLAYSKSPVSKDVQEVVVFEIRVIVR